MVIGLMVWCMIFVNVGMEISRIIHIITLRKGKWKAEKYYEISLSLTINPKINPTQPITQLFLLSPTLLFPPQLLLKKQTK